ncbi:hypothetical protein N7481_008800 [Penicillium waksmanii]|uniref:uncharacterized protein n=1 Tax=Penicillium waksmanii TaxID=69791 RepID=UPI0025480AE9|nr:uncharacterized protein N7481_008800 [Penicillium waksmanii]KAJ5975093.1 hypothetical protein N7481_008800 [Penicillium waksmanii]
MSMGNHVVRRKGNQRPYYLDFALQIPSWLPKCAQVVSREQNSTLCLFLSHRQKLVEYGTAQRLEGGHGRQFIPISQIYTSDFRSIGIAEIFL